MAILAARLRIDRKKAPPGIARMKLQHVVVAEILVEHLANPERRDASLHLGRIVALKDDHVAAVAAPPLEISACGGAFPNR